MEFKGKEGMEIMMRRKCKKAMYAILAAGMMLTGSGCGKAMGAMEEGGGNAGGKIAVVKDGNASLGRTKTDEEGAVTVKAGSSGMAGSAGQDTPWDSRAADKTKKPASAWIGKTEADEGETEEGTGKENPKQEIDAQAEDAGFCAAKDYRELLDALDRNRTGRVQWGFHQDYFVLDAAGGMYDGAMNSGGSVKDTAESGSVDMEPSGKDYSDTNVQVEGIAEADIVKTDGEYIYILSRTEHHSEVFIVRAEEGALLLESSFSPEPSSYTYSWQEEMYVSGNLLVIVRQKDKEPQAAAGSTEDDFYLDRWFGYYGTRQTQILIYDITDRKAPKLAAEHVQDGDYVSSREKDGYLYVISEKGIYYGIMYFDQVSGTEETDVPDAAGESFLAEELSNEDCARLPQVDGGLIAPDAIYFRDNSMDSVYTIVTAIRLDEPEKLADSLSFVAESDHCYMSGNAIYLAAYDWWNYGQKECDETDIVKIAYENGKLRLAAQGKVKGNLDGQFSMDEKDGCLRIVTTVNHYRLVQEGNDIWQDYIGMSNSLYVLDADLKLVGSLENLAKDEMIYSVRFLGDIAYFVTFRNTDPLFSVDVSDPAHPVLLGELKIPGFSDYLHPYGENRLLGIGYHADEDGAVNCVKLTMFDISDPLNVVEKHTLLLEDYDTSEACANHKAVLVDEGRGLIGLPLEGDAYRGGGYWDYTQIKAYAVYGYDEGQGFYPVFEKKYTRDWKYRYYYLEEIEEEDIDVPEELAQKNGDEADTHEASQTQEVAGSAADDWNYDWNKWYYMRLRGIYIGDYFYMVNPMKEVISWQMGQEGFAEGMALELK